MKPATIALILAISLSGCMSQQIQTSGTVESGDHNVVNVSVSENVSEPHLCYTVTANDSFDALVYGDTAEYVEYRRGAPSSPIAALSSVGANKTDVAPDVDLGTDVQPGTHHIVIDNTDYDAIEPLEGGSPSPATDAPVHVNVSATVAEQECPGSSGAS